MPSSLFFSSRRARTAWFAAGLTAVAAALPAAPAPALAWRATRDFQPVRSPDFAPAYAETRDPDDALHGLAVNPRRHRDRFAAAAVVFPGPAGTYTLALHAVAEEDGESVYRIAVNDRLLQARANPATPVKRLPVVHRWEGVALQPGDRLAVHFSGRSNGRVPEGSAFAWSRGRWRSLEALPAAPR